jgi:hypothetical protein
MLLGATNTLFWDLPDPTAAEDAEQPEAFRSTVAEMSARIRPLVELATRPTRGDDPAARWNGFGAARGSDH